jgi:hypothetical protein
VRRSVLLFSRFSPPLKVLATILLSHAAMRLSLRVVVIVIVVGCFFSFFLFFFLSFRYPSLMTPQDQEIFVNHTEADCGVLSTSASVVWEFEGTWANAIKTYFPRYAERGIVRSLFAVNVPYLLPILEFAPGEFYKSFGNTTVLFRPREWRGTKNATVPYRNAQCTPQQLADELGGYPRGSVGHIYLTSDGGASLDSLYQLVALLDDHVEIVDHETLADMALQRDALLHAEATSNAAAQGASAF